MSQLPFPCEYENRLQQVILRVRKDLVTDPDKVKEFINVIHVDDFKVFEEAFYYDVEFQGPCDAGKVLSGKVLMKQVILVGEIHYSVVLYDATIASDNRIYDGEKMGITGYHLYKIAPFEEDVEIIPGSVKPVFETTIERIPTPEDVDFYIYKIDGIVKAEITLP